MRKLLVAIAFSIILISAPLNVSLGQNFANPREPKEILFTSDMQINLVIVGDEWGNEDKRAISSQLIQSYKPMILGKEENIPIGVEYKYNYTFISAPEEFATQLYTFIKTTATDAPMPEPIAQWVVSEHPEFGDVEKIAYRIINAPEIEEFLDDAWPLDDKGYTIFFFMPHNDEFNYLHTYGMLTTDPDTGAEFLQEGMMGFGGSYRFYFIDLTAGPWMYPSFIFCEDLGAAECEQVNHVKNKNIYDITSLEESHNIIAEYVNNAVTLLFTPSYVYAPFYRINHEISIFLIDFTTDRSLSDAADQYINRDLIDQAFRGLIPYAEWTSEVTGLPFDDLPGDLQETILNSLEFTFIGGSDVVIVKSAELIDGLDRWALAQFTEEELNELEAEAETTVFIPVFILVFDSEAYVEEYGIAGMAAPAPADPSIPCCSIVASSRDDVFLTGEGLSVLTIHETAHVLGLAHPHDGYRPDIGNFANWFYDWSYTPLTYAAPTANGCGLDEPCGMIIPDFGRFNFDAIDRGVVLSLLDEVQLNVYDAMVLLDDLGYDSSNLPAAIESSLNSIDSDVSEAKLYFSAMNYFRYTDFRGTSSLMNPMDDALDFALRAFNTSEQLLKEAKMLAEPVITEEPEKKLDISVAMKQKKKVTLISVKNNDELPLFDQAVLVHRLGHGLQAEAEGPAHRHRFFADDEVQEIDPGEVWPALLLAVAGPGRGVRFL